MDVIRKVAGLPRLRSAADAKHGSEINCYQSAAGKAGFNRAETKELLDSLSQNKELETLVMGFNDNFGSSESCRALGELVQTSTTLKHLSLYYVGMHAEGLKHILEGILNNPQSALEAFDLGRNWVLGLHHVDVNVVTDEVGEGTEQSTDPVDSLEGWRALGNLVRTSTTLKHLSLPGVGMRGEGLKLIVERILDNSQSVLETLDVSWNDGLGGEGMKHDDTYVGEGAKQLTALLSGNARALATLDIRSICFSLGEMKSIGQALVSNTTLIELRLESESINVESWKVFWNSVKFNKILQTLGVSYHMHDYSHEDFEDFMGIFHVNYTIKEIRTSLGDMDEKRRSQLQGMLMRNQRLGDYMNMLQENFQFSKPSSGRVFLCGSPFAGKTSLRTSMVNSQAGKQKKAENKLRSIFEQTHLLKRANERTKGIEVRSLRAPTGEQISVWDMAGQEEYRALHDSHFLFPDINQVCLFVFVFKPFDEGKEQVNLTAASERLEKELNYWLSFINSNSRMGDFILPQVVIVLTHLDKLTRIGQFAGAQTYVEWAEEKVKETKVRFCDKVKVHEVIYAVDANSHQDARAVVSHVGTVFRELFCKVAKMPAVCHEINVALGKWVLNHKREPIMDTGEFSHFCREEVSEVRNLFQNVPADLPEDAVVERRNKIWQAIISYLHDSGCILHFPESGSIVVDVNWLGEAFLGRLFSSKDTNMQQLINQSERGIVDKYRLDFFLKKFVKDGKYKGMDTEVLLHLMKELKICENVDSSKLFMPRTLKDAEDKAYSGERKLQWSDMHGDYEHPPVYTGLRLQAEDPLRTFLSPGLFLRYQVHLHRLLTGDIEEGRFSYEIEANLIRVKHDGMEMLIESSGEISDYVDILIRCYDPPTSRDHYTYKYGVSELRRFCASREGCPGVFLKEAILRPECAKRLTLCVHRRSQAVFTESLKESVKKKLLQYVGELQASGMWNKGDSAKMITEQSIESKIYRHRFGKVPDAGLDEDRVKATSLLDDWSDIDNALISHQRSAIDNVIADCRTMNEVLGEIDVAVSAIPQPSTSSRSSSSAAETTCNHLSDKDQTLSEPFDDQDKDRPLTHRDFQVHMREMERRQSLRFERNKNEILSGTKTMIVSALQGVVKEMQVIQQWQEQQISMMQKLEQIKVFPQGEAGMPRFPYFTRYDVKLHKKILALKVVGEAFTLHFVCEAPRQRHFVKDQKGFDINLLKQTKWATRLRPLISASVDIFFILVKAAAHIGAGIGNAIPDFGTWQGAVPLTTVSLATETALNEIRMTHSDEVSHASSKTEWQCLLDEIVGPLLQKKEISKEFGLYQVQYKFNNTTKDWPTLHYWLCKECRERASKAHELVEHSAQMDPLGVVGASDSRYP